MKVIKITFIILGIVIAVIMLLLIILAIYNKIALRAEADKIVPNGKMIDLGDYSVHVYTEGENSAAPTLVFMSGSGTAAPVYDFKSLYSLLTDDYKITVVEKAGYGYSDIIEVSRDIDTMVNDTREALKIANIMPPYVLLPHSMSGLEAIYWAQQFPDEVSGIVGLDMATPKFYDEFDFDRARKLMNVGVVSVKLGLIRIPGVYPLNKIDLTKDEIQQQKLLAYRNALNIDCIIEGNAVAENSKIVKSGKDLLCPILLFSSNGKEVGDFWISSQEEFAKVNNAELKIFDCGHYLHYYKSEEMSAEIKSFIKKLN